MRNQANVSRCWSDLPGAPAPGCRLAGLQDIPDGGALLKNLGAGAQTFRIILLRSGESVFAYVNRCAHFGVPLAEAEHHLGIHPHRSIRCSVHHARYRWADGYCEWGDCEGESLWAIPVILSGDNVLIST